MAGPGYRLYIDFTLQRTVTQPRHIHVDKGIIDCALALFKMHINHEVAFLGLIDVLRSNFSLSPSVFLNDSDCM